MAIGKKYLDDLFSDLAVFSPDLVLTDYFSEQEIEKFKILFMRTFNFGKENSRSPMTPEHIIIGLNLHVRLVLEEIEAKPNKAIILDTPLQVKLRERLEVSMGNSYALGLNISADYDLRQQKIFLLKVKEVETEYYSTIASIFQNTHSY